VKKTTTVPVQGRTAKKDVSFERVLELIGDDPETLLLAIRMLDRMYERRVSRRRTKRRTASY
jgi:hypothetical protein